MDHQLANVIGLHVPVPALDGSELYLVAAGPLTKQPGSNAGRLVMVLRGDEFIIWHQRFIMGEHCHRDERGQLVFDSNGVLDSGNYMSADDIGSAYEKFLDRCKSDCLCTNSIYREQRSVLELL